MIRSLLPLFAILVVVVLLVLLVVAWLLYEVHRVFAGSEFDFVWLLAGLLGGC